MSPNTRWHAWRRRGLNAQVQVFLGAPDGPERRRPQADAEPKPPPPPAAVRSALIWCGVAAGIVGSLAGLNWMDRQEGALKAQLAALDLAALQRAEYRATVRQCSATAPFVFVIRQSKEASTQSKAVRARPGLQTVGLSETRRESRSQPSGEPRILIAGPWSYEEMVDQLAKWQEGRTGSAERSEELHDEAGLRRCAFALKRVNADAALSAKAAPPPPLLDTLFVEGTGLNTVLRLLKVLLLGIFALCTAEAVLRMLKLLGLPIVSLTDLAKLGTDMPAAKSGGGDPAPRPAGHLMQLVGTTLITGLTGAVVVAPELVQQANTASHVAQSKTSELRDFRSQTKEVSIQELRERSEIRLHEMSYIAERGDRATASQSEIASLTQQVQALTQVTNALALKLASEPPKPNTILLPAPKSTDEIAKEAAAIAAQVRTAFATDITDLQRVRTQVEGMTTGFSSNTASIGRLEEVLRKRTCALLAYVREVESKRSWWYAQEGTERLQRMKEMQGHSSPIGDCAPAAAPPGDAVMATSATAHRP